MDIIKLLPNEIKNKIFQYWAEHPLATILRNILKYYTFMLIPLRMLQFQNNRH
jgi:hypothetical protein